MCKVIFNIRVLFLIVVLLLAATNCTRLSKEERDKKFPNKGESQTSQPVINNESENRIIELQDKINSLIVEKRETDRLLKYYVSTLDGVCIVLKDINIGYNEIYSGKLETPEIRGLKDKLLDKIEQIKKFIDDKQKSVQGLSISQEEIEEYEKLVEDLKGRLEIQRMEINQLQEDNIAQRRQNLEQREKYLEQREKNLDQREENFNLKKDISSLEEKFKRINEQLQQEQEKGKTRYFLRITPNSFEPAKCTEEEKFIPLKKDDNMITSHPIGSFRIEQRDEIKRILRILDWENFWMEGKFFIVFNKELTRFAEEVKKKRRKK